MISRRPERQDIEELLPWHAAGTLSRPEADLVGRALSADAELARRYDPPGACTDDSSNRNARCDVGTCDVTAIRRNRGRGGACATPPAHQPNACPATVRRIAPAPDLLRTPQA